MLKPVLPVLAAGLLAASSTLHAQPASPKGSPQRFDCSQARDPKACEERLAKRREAMQKARAACEGRQGEERADCMRREACAQAADPAKCEARAKEQSARRAQMREACKGQTGEAWKSCMQEQRGKK